MAWLRGEPNAIHLRFRALVDNVYIYINNLVEKIDGIADASFLFLPLFYLPNWHVNWHQLLGSPADGKLSRAALSSLRHI